MSRRVVLASASRIRASLLANAGVPVSVCPAAVDEASLRRDFEAGGAAPAPAEIARHLAQAKALAVSRLDPEGLVIGADQVLSCAGEIFSKPAGRDVARAQLLQLRGRTHRLDSAVACARAGTLAWSHVAGADLTMRAFSDAFLDDYLERAGSTILASVGAYQLEGLGAQLFARIEGDYFTILGLPLLPLLTFLRSDGSLAS